MNQELLNDVVPLVEDGQEIAPLEQAYIMHVVGDPDAVVIITPLPDRAIRL